MPELGPFGSVRGASGNGHPYRDRFPFYKRDASISLLQSMS